jgi:hypothetical protein
MPRSTTARRATPSARSPRHADDLHAWVESQVALLRAGEVAGIDASHIAEELADLGNEQLDKLESALAVLTMHLLKWDHQPWLRSRSWQLTVREQRRRIDRLLRRSPSLKSKLAEALDEGYADGRDRALAETGLPEAALPLACPYSLDDVMTRPLALENE